MKPGLSYGAVLALTACAAAGPARVDAREAAAGHVSARLVSEVSAIVPGEPFWVGVHFDIEDTWHINWKNPGDAGLPPRIEWTLPEGFTAGDVVWPAPDRFVVGPLAIFGYEGQSYLLAEITPPAQLPAGTEARLGATVDWLACQEICVPGDARVSLLLPVRADGPQWNKPARAVFANVRARVPSRPDGWSFSANLNAETVELTANPGGREVSLPFFYPERAGLIENGAEQTWRRRGDAYVLEIERATYRTEPPLRLRGVFVAQTPSGETVIDVDCELMQR